MTERLCGIQLDYDPETKTNRIHVREYGGKIPHEISVIVNSYEDRRPMEHLLREMENVIAAIRRAYQKLDLRRDCE